MSSLRDTRVVWHVHDFVSNRRIMANLLRRLARRCSAVIANSDSVAQDVRMAFGERMRVTRVYNAVDLERFDARGSTADLDVLAGASPAPAGAVRVGLIATLARWKGHEVFLAAIALLPTSLSVRAYVISGALYQTEGSQFTIAHLRERANALGIADRVAFTGFVTDPSAAMRALDIVVHASTEPEPFGLVIAEAMACGRPVVVSAGGGAAELVTPGFDALTHAPGDTPGLAAAIERLALEPALREALGERAAATARRRFDRVRLAPEIRTVYEHARGARR